MTAPTAPHLSPQQTQLIRHIAAGLLSLAAVWAGAALGATWDRATAAARRHYAPGSHRR